MSVDYRALQSIRDKMEKSLNEKQRAAFMESCAKEIAARLLRLAIRNTPVGQYPKGSGRTGGTLKRSWTTGGGGQQDIKVHSYDGVYVVEITNPTEYASYVEWGHRTRGGAGFVEGRFMMTKAEIEVSAATPKLLEKRIAEFLGSALK